MWRYKFIPSLVLILLFSLVTLTSAQNYDDEAEPLTLEDLVKLSQAGISDEIIIGQIISSESQFELTADDLIYLKENGVSDGLLDFLVNTPSLEEWEKLEDEWAEGESETIEGEIMTQYGDDDDGYSDDETDGEYSEDYDYVDDAEVRTVYKHIYIDVDYWRGLHPYWYWDVYWDGIYPIGYYCHNGRYYYYFGAYYWYYHPHYHHDHYYHNHHYYKPPRPYWPGRHKPEIHPGGDRGSRLKPSQVDRTNRPVDAYRKTDRSKIPANRQKDLNRDDRVHRLKPADNRTRDSRSSKYQETSRSYHPSTKMPSTSRSQWRGGSSNSGASHPAPPLSSGNSTSRRKP